LDGLFELDGNTIDEAKAGDDWSNFPVAPCGNNCGGTSHTTKATGRVADTNPAVFRNGSKDTQDISDWRYDLGSSPPKDDMLHAYAAAYTATAAVGTTTSIGDLLIYFGADRAAFNGTASLGFWFFKKPIGKNDANGTFVLQGTTTPATHSEGDTLVAFEYTNGGAVTGVRVFKWTNGGLLESPPIDQAPTNTVDVFCDPFDRVCGSTNKNPTTLASGEAILAGQLFEGGINISKVIGGDACFASFMATSRSSDTAVASIKNFILAPSFPICHLTVTKQCDAAEYVATNDTALFTVKGAIVNDGGGTLTNITLVDNPAFNAGTLQYFACDAGGLPTGNPLAGVPSSLSAGSSVCYRGKHSSTTLSKFDEVTASASTGSSTLTGTASVTCSIPPPSTGLSVTKICDLDLVQQNSQLGVRVNFSGSVTNTSEVTLKNVSVCESHENGSCAAVKTIGDMAPGAVVLYNGNYMPSLALNGAGVSTLTEPKNAVFKDTARATGTLPLILGGGAISSAAQEATCTLCAP
jgi:hypothetical protein